MDVTENPLVALYFACKEESIDKEKEYGTVYLIKVNEYNISNYALTKEIADTYRLISDNCTDVNTIFERFSKQAYFDEYAFANEEFFCYLKKQFYDNKVIYVHAEELFERQKHQLGRYFLFPNLIKENQMSLNELAVFPEDEILACINIRDKYKYNIIRDLRNVGIDKSFLFPESVEAGCEKIVDEIKKKISCNYGRWSKTT